jgi:hypothetical protein
LWLEQRLGVVQLRLELIKNKLAILDRKEQRLARRAAEGTGDWQRLCPEAETSLPAAVLSGRRTLTIASNSTMAQADVAMGFTLGSSIRSAL